MGKFLSDLEIAANTKMKNIEEIADSLGMGRTDIVLHGDHMAKIKMTTVRQLIANKQRGKLILVSAMTPTPAGEGKTTVSIGLAQSLRKLNHNAIVVLREPSLGPCFGTKGGAAGGGYSQVLPMEDINLHFTGDLHAVSAAHNLIATALDNHIHFGSKDYLSIRNVFWKRVVDMNDRSLRQIIIGLGSNGFTRESGFEITAASEIMAILCLSNSYSELKEKIGNILLGLRLGRTEPFFARDLNIHGAAASLLKNALMPNLVQTIEHGPALVHGGPFANIAQGANSILATKLGLALCDYVVTEAGFGFDLGAEKFFNIVSRYGNFCPSAVVLVATCRALKYHGGMSLKEIGKPNPQAVIAGGANLLKHIENAKKFNVDVVVALNQFVDDSLEEITAVQDLCKQADTACQVVNVWKHGGAGAIELANSIVNNIAAKPCQAKPLYNWAAPVEDKITTIAQEIYGAREVFFQPEAKKDLELIYKLGFNNLPICMAKTQNSLSDNPKWLGSPRDFILSIREIVISSGAGFLVPLTGEIMRMPGLPKVPSAQSIDIDENGTITGLF